jgi:hypothetical protein
MVLLLLFAGCGGFYGFLIYSTDRDLREAEADADVKDPGGWRLSEIDAHRKVLADEDNAAEVVMAIKSNLPTPWPPARPAPADAADGAAPPVPPGQQVYIENDLADLPPDVQLDEALLRDLRDSFKGTEKALAEARKLPAFRDGRYPLTWSKDIISTLINSQDARAAANLMRLQAVLLAQEGKADQALEATRGVLVAGRSVGDEPLMISMLIRVACTAIAISSLERVLAQGEPSADELKKMQELLEAEAAEPLLLNATRGERASMHQLMIVLKTREIKPSVAVGPGGNQGFNFAFDLAGPTLARTSHARMLRLLTEMVEITKLPPEEQAEPMQALEQKVKQARVNYDVLIALLMPAMFKVSQAYQRDQAMLRCAIVAVAAERYRRDHGGWPAKLDELVQGGYLKEVPKDPYDGQLLRYKRMPDGVVVYSVGPDKQDDGGARNRSNPLTKGTDYPFRLWDVNRRRQPPAEVLPQPSEGWGEPGAPGP